MPSLHRIQQLFRCALVLPGILLSVLLALSGADHAQAPAVDFAPWLDALESSSEDERAAAFERLLESGPRAALAALTGAPGAGLTARRTRAWLLYRIGETEAVPGAIRWLNSIPTAEEADAEVRRFLIDFLSRADLADKLGAERAAALVQVVERDPNADLVDHALTALASMRHPEAGRALDRLVDGLPESRRARAARGLAGTATGRQAVLRRIRALGGDGREPPADVLAALILSYGRVLADEPGVGEVLADIAPIVALSRHVDDRVRIGARLALESLIGRSAQKLDVERCTLVFDALERAGWPARDLEYRRALLAMRFTEEPLAALASARRVQEWAQLRTDREALRFRFFGLYLEAVALAAGGRAEFAEPYLDRALSVIDALRAARIELLPETSNPAKSHAGEAVDYARFSALIELMRATVLLLAGRDQSDLEVLETLRRVHVRLLEARLLAAHLLVDVRCDLDSILDHDLGPRRLLYDNSINPDLNRDRGIELMQSLGRGLATVAGAEMPGFAPFELFEGQVAEEGREGLELEAIANPLLDPKRFELLYEYQFARLQRLRVEYGSGRGGSRMQMQLGLQMQLIDRRMQAAQALIADGEPREVAFEFLARERVPSNLALWLALDLRMEGRPVETRELAERMLDDLRETGLINTGLESEIGLAIASSYTEEGRAEQAESKLLGVLAEIEAALAQYRKDRESTREDDDADMVAVYDMTIRRTERRVADCLVSLAVNANVRQGDREKALAYFERAFELNQSDFMRALLACYRARSGRLEEARVQLREVAPAPALYYNMACTYALMGESALALDFLQRDFEENQQSRGALKRQKAWAREDPDLRSLRELGPFQRLIE